MLKYLLSCAIFLSLAFVSLSADAQSCLSIDPDACAATPGDPSNNWSPSSGINYSLLLENYRYLDDCNQGLRQCNIPPERELCYQECLTKYEAASANCSRFKARSKRAVCYQAAMEKLSLCQRKCPGIK